MTTSVNAKLLRKFDFHARSCGVLDRGSGERRCCDDDMRANPQRKIGLRYFGVFYNGGGERRRRGDDDVLIYEKLFSSLVFAAFYTRGAGSVGNERRHSCKGLKENREKVNLAAFSTRGAGSVGDATTTYL